MKSCLFEAIIINQGILRLDHDVQIPVSPVRLEERCQRNNNLIVAVASETSSLGFKSSYDSESVGTDTNILANRIKISKRKELLHHIRAQDDNICRRPQAIIREATAFFYRPVICWKPIRLFTGNGHVGVRPQAAGGSKTTGGPPPPPTGLGTRLPSLELQPLF